MIKIQKIFNLKLFLGIYLLFGGGIYGQNLCLKGKIIDQGKQPVEFVYISLLNKDSKLKIQTVTDSLGSFKICTSSGEYKLVIEQYDSKFRDDDISLNKNLDLGEIIVDGSIELEGLTVTTRKKIIERKIDRLVFNVENSAAASGGTGIDVLKVTPSLNVLNDNIAIVGKSGVSVMIDDKIIKLSGQNLIEYIKSLNAADIKSVEVITNPPAKYQAQGNSGIVNIKLKKAALNSWNNASSASYVQASRPTFTVSDVFNYNKNKLTVGANINYRKGASAPIEKQWIYFPEQTWKEQSKRKDFYDYFTTRLALGYKFNDRLKVNVQYNFTKGNPHYEDNGIVRLINNTNSSVDSLLVNIGKEKEKSNLNTFNVNATYLLDTIQKRIITFDFDHLDYRVNNNRTFVNNNYLSGGEKINDSYYSGNNIGDQSIKNYSFNVDVDFPTKFIKLNYGSRLSFSKINSDLSFYDLTSGVPVIDDNQTNKFNYKEYTQAVYFSANKDVGDKWKFQVGFRFENTQTTGISLSNNQKNKNNYLKVFPTAYILYDINESNSININYGRRINRPRFDWLNPFRIYSSLYFYVEGNPFLQPSFSHNFELNYTYKNNLNFQLYYNRIEDGYGQVTFVDPNDITSNLAKPVNYFKSDYVGFSLSYMFRKIKWLESLTGFNYNYTISKSDIPEVKQNLKGNNAYFYLNNTFVFSDNTSFNINYFYQFPGISDLYTQSEFSQLNMSFRLYLKNKKIQVSLFANDVLKTNKPMYSTFNNDVKINYRNYYDLRSFGMSVIYRFGNSKLGNTKYSVNKEEERL